MITFTCPDFPGLTIRADDRIIKFAGGVLRATRADAEAVVAFAAAHPEYGVKPTALPERKRAKAKAKPEETPEEAPEA